MKKNIAFCLSLIATQSMAVAAASLTSSGTIIKMSSIGHSNFQIWGAFSDPENCGDSSKVVVGYHSSDTEESRNAEYSMAMAAFLSDKKVRFWVDGCVGNHPIVSNIEILK